MEENKLNANFLLIMTKCSNQNKNVHRLTEAHMERETRSKDKEYL